MDCKLEAAMSMAEDIRRDQAGDELNFTSSFGVVEYTTAEFNQCCKEKMEDLETACNTVATQMIEMPDTEILYLAKRNSKNRVEVKDAVMDIMNFRSCQ